MVNGLKFFTEDEVEFVLSGNGSSKSRMHGFFKALRFIILFVSKCVNVKDLMSNLSCISTIFLVVGKF